MSFVVLTVALVLLYRWCNVPFTPLMIIRTVEQKSEGKEARWEHDWVELKNISEKMQLAVVCSEDQNFLRHSGFDWKAMRSAIMHNDTHSYIRGGSTISQQTAKNVFLWPGRSYLRKGLEAWFTVLIEILWSKERILEVYLNVIEMGDGVYGAEAAAQHWFKKPAAKLNTDEAAALTAILPNPLRYKANPPGAYIEKRKNWIKQQMNFWGNRLDFEKYNSDGEEETSPEKNTKN